MTAGLRLLFTGKRGLDRTPMQVSVRPAATIAFGESNAPAGAQDINHRWKKQKPSERVRSRQIARTVGITLGFHRWRTERRP